MGVEQVSSSKDQIKSIIQRAAQNNQQDFNYMLAQARIESGLNPAAKAKTSSASGLYQFTSGTWMDLVKRHGEKLGLGDAALSLRNGSITASEKNALLVKRHDPALSSELAARFAIENAQTLQRSGHEKIGSTELYIAHFLGPQGANTFLTGLKTNPGGPAAQALPQAAGANAQIFFADGKARSYSEIFSGFQKKFAGADSSAPVITQSPQADGKARSYSEIFSGFQKKFAGADSSAPVIPQSPQLAATQNRRIPGQPAPLELHASAKTKNENMTAPALNEANSVSEVVTRSVAAEALREAAQEANVQTSDLNLDEASLGSFLRGFSFHQADPGLTPVINDAETRDASQGAGSQQNRGLYLGSDLQVSGHAIGGKLIVKTIDRDERALDAKVEEARRPAPAPIGKATFTDLAALWGGASKASSQRTS